MKTSLLLIIVTAQLAIGQRGFTQSMEISNNVPVATPAPVAADRNAWAHQVADDAGKLVYDFLDGFSLRNVLESLICAYMSMQFLLKKTSLGYGTGFVSRWLHHLAIERFDPQAPRPPDPVPVAAVPQPSST